ncbi:MAG: hypothetical protein RIR51_1016 [Bacteroidota bacterium]
MNLKKITSHLTFWVLIFILLGIFLGSFAKEWALYPVFEEKFKYSLLGTSIELGPTLAEIFSGLFISLVKLFINPIIFLTISLGIVQMGDLKKVGRVGAKSILYFEIVTTFALIIGILVAHFIQPGANIFQSSENVDKISAINQQAQSFEWSKFFYENSTIQVLLLAILTGIILNRSNRVKGLIQALSKISNYVYKGLHWVMYTAPLGALGGIAITVAKYGIDSLLPLAKLMVTVYITMAIFIFLILGAILRHCKENIFEFLSYIKEELLIVLGTSSSEAGLPSLMEKLEKKGCSKSVVGLVVPAGYSFNLDGTTIYLSMAIMFLSQVYKVDFTFEQILTIIGVLMVTSKGAAGVAGSGFMVLASTLNALHVIPLEGLALLIGVDRFMSEARAITNFIGNGVATIWISKNENEFNT